MDDTNIPLVGQPAQLIYWYPTVLMKCNCQEGRLSLVIITGIENATACGNCGRMFMNKGFTQTPNGQQVIPNIIMMVPTKETVQ